MEASRAALYNKGQSDYEFSKILFCKVSTIYFIYTMT